jgi:tRNA U34 5-methylaminomethyl-2-thiouridine-forming methyltransferase MnmC
MNVEIRTTHDGSHTLFNPDLNESYHSVFGAIDESNHVFIEAGLKSVLSEKKGIFILEVGFGTGLNAWLSLCNLPADTLVTYITLEPYPVPRQIIDQLNYPQQRDFSSELNQLYFSLHQADWHIEQHITPQFHLRKIPESVTTFQPYWFFDLIYFDAFAPTKQPSMWSKEIFQKLYNITVPGGMLVTYCAKGQVKRDLKEVGWVVEKLPGPTGKREMTRAFKPI